MLRNLRTGGVKCGRNFATVHALPPQIYTRLSDGSAVDVSVHRNAIRIVHERNNGTEEPSSSSLSGQIRELTGFVRRDIFPHDSRSILSDLVSLRLRDMSVVDMSYILHCFSLDANAKRDYEEQISDLLDDLTSVHRSRDVESLKQWRTCMYILDSLMRLDIPNTGAVRLCAERLVLEVPQMDADDIGRVLSALRHFKLSHKRFIDTIIFLLPAIPCSDAQLAEIVDSIIVLDGGTPEDRQFLQQLVKYRNATVVD